MHPDSVTIKETPNNLRIIRHVLHLTVCDVLFARRVFVFCFRFSQNSEKIILDVHKYYHSSKHTESFRVIGPTVSSSEVILRSLRDREVEIQYGH